LQQYLPVLENKALAVAFLNREFSGKPEVAPEIKDKKKGQTLKVYP
jgi:hypothetical protein